MYVCFKVKIKKPKEDAPLSHCFLVTRKNSGILERSEDKEHRLVVYFKFRYFSKYDYIQYIHEIFHLATLSSSYSFKVCLAILQHYS